MKKEKRILSFILSLILALSVLSLAYAADDAKSIFNEIIKEDFEKNSTVVQDLTLEEKIYMVSINAKSVLELIDENYSEEEANKIATKAQEEAIAAIKYIKDVEIRERYVYAANGFSIKCDPIIAKKISYLSQVKNISEANIYEKHVKNVRDTYEIARIAERYNLKGEGMVVAVLDSGVDHTHKDMNVDKDNVKLNEEKVKEIKNKEQITYGTYFNEKVPFAYNYADQNLSVRDKLTERADFSHGTHVAGIIGANAKDDKGVTGIAPNAQILNMKIFSNNPKNPGADEEKIVKAIEDSVKLGADVINMSFGITAGLQDPSDLQQQAIKAATDKGAIVVAAAGNDAYSTFPNRDKKSIDDGTLSAPGIAEEAIQVGSFENSKLVVNSFIAKLSQNEKRIGYYTSDHDPEALKADYDLVDCGLGSKEDVANLNLDGKIALVKRGDIEFKDKKLNVQAKGAIGAIIYNEDGDNKLLPYISTDEKVLIPTLFISNEDGKFLLDNIKNIKVNFTNERIVIDSVNGETASEFSSWGPTPNLGLKPDLIAVGGNVYSTMENNSYGNMSGTSMAAPMISGISALLSQKFKADGIKNNLPNYVKTALMNTAEPKIKDGKPYSVRLQGAGMVNLEAAVESKVFAKSDGVAKVELKEITNARNIKVDFENNSDDDINFDIEVLGDTFNIDKKSCTVKKGKSSIYITITPKVAANEYVDGYIVFKSSNTKVSLPVLGFNGDWSSLPMFDSIDKDKSIYNQTRLDTADIGPLLTKLKPLGGDELDPKLYAINPDNQNAYWNVLVKFSLLRVAKDFKITVTNEAGEEIKVIEDKENVRKVVSYRDQVKAIVNFDWLWKGGIYDEKLGVQKTVDEGRYYINVYATPDYPNAKPQKISFPLIVDKTAPEVSSNVYFLDDEESVELKVKAKDKGNPASGINKFMFIINGRIYKEDDNALFKLDENGGEYKKIVNLEGKHPFYSINIGATDYANNVDGSKSYVIIKKNSKIDMSIDKTSIKSGEEVKLSYKLNDTNVARYEVSLDNLDDLSYQGTETEQNLKINSNKGKHRIIVKALNKDGLVIDVNYLDINVEDTETEDGLVVSNHTKNYLFRNGEIYTASYQLKNTSAEEKSVSFIIALYDLNDNIVNTAVAEKKLKAGEEANMTNGIKIPDTGEYKLKIFVWDSVKDMNTIVPVNIIKQK
ncbi:S8 family serine peptidase [Fenollaria timonensis]|uniref:S8 family serine peptidase n=1 Tax=Fenollaria timonensis TaxID=1723384 RepID=UPI00071CF78B|nr:S8 family serine peptidase [Fenollaria timonensis]